MATKNQAKTHPPTIRAVLSGKRRLPEAVLEHIDEGDAVIVGMFNSEPVSVLDALEANAERLTDIWRGSSPAHASVPTETKRLRPTPWETSAFMSSSRRIQA